jgi:hypothetical protein
MKYEADQDINILFEYRVKPFNNEWQLSLSYLFLTSEINKLTNYYRKYTI